ncbi:hypothetical protein IQ06DRAFT_365941 [Phaeosphaeriaceae sp. SRC1lsM3a]|nr:hypothetical protein IQ06DRAFT_365941 [Stagonospora sp. SRC1lsM3a]
MSNLKIIAMFGSSSEPSKGINPSSLDTPDSTQLPVLLLPPKIHNYVYDYLVKPPKQTIRLKRDLSNNGTWSLISFANGSKQLRAELRPLVFKNVKLQVWLRDYPAFVDAFYRLDNADHPPLHVRLLVGRDLCPPCTIDMHPLLLAKSMTRELHVEVERLPSCPSKHRGYFDSVRGLLSGPSRRLLRDVESGYMTYIKFRYEKRTSQVFLTITISKRAGELTPAELAKCEQYYGLFNNHFNPIRLTIKATDLCGKHVEEWFGRGRYPPRKKIGKDWLENMGHFRWY